MIALVLAMAVFAAVGIRWAVESDAADHPRHTATLTDITNRLEADQ